MSNVLVYSGPGVSASALTHTLRSLRTLLPSYDVQCINAQSLALDPWTQSTSLLVIPGGRDLPYIEQLSQTHKIPFSRSSTNIRNARADERIRSFVQQEGGAFVGICAGAYYASSFCDFERDDPIMQVVGDRKALRFYPGTCKGTAYPGFVYESDQGARLVDVELAGNEELKERHWSTYYNGGGAFMNAEQFQGQGVEILGRYVSEKDASKAGSNSSQHGLKPGYEGQAAVVYCKCGNGRAILYGNHPEFPLSIHERPTKNTNAPESLPSGPSADTTLQKLEAERLFVFGKHLQLLGLEVALPESETKFAAPSNVFGAEQSQPLLTPLALITKSDQQANSIYTSLLPIAVDPSKINALEGSPNEGRLLSISDTNDTIHFYDISSATRISQLCSSANYTPYLTPVVTSTSDEARSEPEMEVDLQKVPKYVVIAPNGGVGLDVTLLPHWKPNDFSEALEKSREIIATQIREGWATSAENHFDQWNSSGNSVILAESYTYTHVVTSTQTMLDKNYKLLNRMPNGFTSFATHQVSGRGRGKNAWISPLGCLQFSTLLHIPSPQKTFWHAGLGAIVFVQYLAGLAIVESVRSGALGEEYRKALGNKIRIKWPNDIYAQVGDNNDDQQTKRKGTFVWHNKVYAKMAGVLVNSQFAGTDLALVVGCGINTLNARPTTSLSDLIETYNSQNPLTPLPLISQERFAGAILSTFEKMWNTFLQSGGDFKPFIESYKRAWLHSDQETLLSDTNPPTRAKIVGITSDHGLLRCIPLEQDGTTSFALSSINSDNQLAWGSSNAPGQWIDLQPDGNSFDMLQNLIRKKE